MEDLEVTQAHLQVDILYDKDDNILYSGGEYLGITTNNQAEYHAVKMGLKMFGAQPKVLLKFLWTVYLLLIN